MKALLVALAAMTVLMTASCRTTTSQHAARTTDDACLAWSQAYVETVLSVANGLRRDEPMAAVFLVGDDIWPASPRRREAIADAGYEACVTGMAGRFETASVRGEACEASAREEATAGAGAILKAQARRAAMTAGSGTAGPGPTANRVTATFVDGYLACMGEDAG